VYGSSVNNYVTNCINKFEAITEVHTITTALSAFKEMYWHGLYNAIIYIIYIVYRGDFPVPFKHDDIPAVFYKQDTVQFKDDNVSVFQLLYDMTSVMLKKSTKLNEKAGKFIYHKILWSK